MQRTPFDELRSGLEALLRDYARAVDAGQDAAEDTVRDAELTALVLLKHHIDARLAETGPYVAEVTPLS